MVRRREIATVFGNTSGLKKSEISLIERLYRRRVPPKRLLTNELARFLAELSQQINRQIGLLVARDGGITHVIVGDTGGIFLPDLEYFRLCAWSIPTF